jgi:hypothetical protein
MHCVATDDFCKVITFIYINKFFKVWVPFYFGHYVALYAVYILTYTYIFHTLVSGRSVSSLAGIKGLALPKVGQKKG